MDTTQTHAQKSPEWFAARLGKFTGSRISDLLKQPRLKADKEAGKLGETAKSYVIEKVCETISGKSVSFSNEYVEHGEFYEPIAIKKYEEITGHNVIPVGFVPYGKNSGGSPDGRINLHSGDKILEVKCPYHLHNHMKLVLANNQEGFKKIFGDYYCQMQLNMMAAGVSKCDFVTFHPDGYPYNLAILEIEVEMEMQSQLIEALAKAEKYRAEVKTLIDLRKTYDVEPSSMDQEEYDSLMKEVNIPSNG